jgi:hypothetical protein
VRGGYFAVFLSSAEHLDAFGGSNRAYYFCQKIIVMGVQTSPPLTNVQLELLKLFAMGVSEEEVLEIRRMLARHFMQKAIQDATKVWEEKGYTAEQLLNEPS